MKKSTTILAGFVLLFATSAFTVKSNSDSSSEKGKESAKSAAPISENSEAFALPKSVLVEEDKVFTKVEIDASFSAAGGWAAYVKKAINFKAEDLLEEGTSVTCKLSFVVSKEGTVKDVKVLSMQDSKLAGIITEAFKNAPKWLPAQQNGINVNSKREQAISFLIK